MTISSLKYSALLCTVTLLVACGGGSPTGDNNTNASSSAVANTSTPSVLSSAAPNSSAISSNTLTSSSLSSVSLSSSTTSSEVLSSIASSSLPSSTATSSSPAFAAPQNLQITPANGSVSLSWGAVAGASGYNVYYATDANIIPANINSFADGKQLLNVTSPLTINALAKDKLYYFVVTARNGNTESPASSEVSAIPAAVALNLQPNAQETLVVELVNRARANPNAEALRFAIGLNDGITATAITSKANPPLAHNLLLLAAARAHSQWMLDTDIFSHTGVNNSTPGQRMTSAGYVFTGSWSNGENIAWGGTTGKTINLTSYAASQHEGLFRSPGHRVNILGESFRELGVGQLQGYFLSEGKNYLSSMMSQAFAKTGTSYFITGVVYNDVNNNNFYDVGEGLGGIRIKVNDKYYLAFDSGAYSIPATNGSYRLEFSGVALSSTAVTNITLNNANLKQDLIKSSNGSLRTSP